MNPFFLWLAAFAFAATVATAVASRRPVRTEVCPGATYFYSGTAPAWAHDKRVVCRIGNHVFLTDKRNNHP